MENGYIKSLITNFLKKTDGNPAFRILSGKAFSLISYPEFGKDILTCAGYFRDHAIYQKNIALMGRSNYDFFVAFFAVAASGNTAVILNPDLPADQIYWQCQKAEIAMIYTEGNRISALHDMVNDYPIVTCGELRERSALNLQDVDCDDDRTILMVFTSGTTGRSKVVEMAGRNLKASADSADEMYEIPGMDHALHAFPPYHIGGFRSVLVCVNRMETVNIGRGLKYLLMDIPVFNPACIGAVPAMLDGLVKLLKSTTTAEERQKYLGNQLCRIIVGGAAPKLQTIKYLVDLGIRVDVIYGMTESGGVATWGMLDVGNISSIGKAFRGIECCILDGEISFRGDSIMKGYYKDPEETARVMVDGWLRSGDLGRCDEDGYYYITGRKKNVIILSNGENVNPEEIEDKLGELSAVLECMVYSDGKGIRADVYTEDQEAAAKQIRGYNDEAPTYHQIYKVDYFAEPLEKTSSGKIKRKENIYEQ